MPNNAGKYMIVPLSTFAQTFTNQNPSYGTLGAEYCAIYVEDIYLQDDYFMLGAMFFQQFFAMFQTEIGSTQFSFVNITRITNSFFQEPTLETLLLLQKLLILLLLPLRLLKYPLQVALV